MSQWFSKPYDIGSAFSLYCLYESGDDSVLNDLISHLCPLIRKCARIERESIKQCDRQTIEADALNEVYNLVKSKDIPTNHPKVFTRFLCTAIIRFFKDSIRNLYSQQFDYWTVARVPESGRLPSHYEVEAKIYSEQTIRNLRRDVLHKLRFIGEERVACEFILDCRLGYRNLDPMVAKRRCNLNGYDCRLLLKHVDVLIKAMLWRYGEREHKDGPLAFDWSTGRSFLCAPGELGAVHVSPRIV